MLGVKNMKYCQFSSDKITLSVIASMLQTSQQLTFFDRYKNEIKKNKHPTSFLDFYRTQIEKYNLEPDVNYDLLERLQNSQKCANYVN